MQGEAQHEERGSAEAQRDAEYVIRESHSVRQHSEPRRYRGAVRLDHVGTEDNDEAEWGVDL